ncbi:MAG TPA: hypothetical protein VJP86_04680 [Vicinamibacterales bacterium]|jgi:hypothetical protein|nr:hypothetical protein [Vicinamibacterales bacterium]
MIPRKHLVTALASLTLGLATVIGVGAQNFDVNHSMTLTFNKPVSLPGVTLGAGSYIFEFPDRVAAHSVVRVLSQDRRRVYLTAFTQAVRRPANLPRNQYVTFAEASPASPQPIAAWWPWDMSTGRQFIYAK